MEKDAQGHILARHDYRPYGASQGTPAPAGPGYTGHVNDPDTGLVYMQQRYYDAEVGQFASVDPIGPAPGNIYNINRYAYANNNPVVLTDPTGMHSAAEGDCDAACRVYQGNGNSDVVAAAQQKGRAAQQHVSPQGQDFIKGWEGWNGTFNISTGRWVPKDDGFGNGTIGWGHNCGSCADFAGGITKAQGDALFTTDLASYESSVSSITGGKASQQQFDALVSFAFNVKSYKGSTLMRNAASGSPVSEANFTAYRNASKHGVLVPVPSLLKRRESEWDIYANGIYNSSH